MFPKQLTDELVTRGQQEEDLLDHGEAALTRHSVTVEPTGGGESAVVVRKTTALHDALVNLHRTRAAELQRLRAVLADAQPLGAAHATLDAAS